MGRTSKGFLLFLFVILAVSSLIMVESSSAQSIPTPSVPQFTAKYADHSYDMPATTTSSTDPYTGKTTTYTHPGYHVQNFMIDVTIKNQPFPSTINGNPSFLYYEVGAKGHFQKDWYATDNPFYGNNNPQSNSEYTVLSFSANYPAGGQVDIRVQAILGYTYFNYEHIQPMTETASTRSDWSSTQTITIPEASTSTPDTSQNPMLTASPTVPEFPILVILPLFVTMFLIATKLFRRKQPSKKFLTRRQQ